MENTDQKESGSVTIRVKEKIFKFLFEDANRWRISNVRQNCIP